VLVTYSIVARDPDTRELGVAVQSRAFNAGAACAWAEAGVDKFVPAPAVSETGDAGSGEAGKSAPADAKK